MTAILDTTLRYQDSHGSRLHCRLRIFAPPDRPAIVVATELTFDAGTSITAMIKRLSKQVAIERGLEPDDLIWVEHSPARKPIGLRSSLPETFALVEFDRPGTDNGDGFAPRRVPTSRETVEDLIGHGLESADLHVKSA